MRKILYGALALSAALTLSIGSVAATDESPAPAESPAATEAPAADVDFGSKASVSALTDDTLLIDANGAKEVLVGTAKVAKSKNGQVMKVSAWDTYVVDETGTVAVDLSKIATTKDSYLRIKADAEADSDAVTVKLPAVSSKLKATYDKATETIAITDNKQPVKKDLAFTARTVNSDRNEVTTVEGGLLDDTQIPLETYRMSGGVIYLSLAQGEQPASWTKGVATDIMEEDGKTPVAVVTAPTRCSKELKVTIAKRANAPKLSVNYVKGTIAIPAKAQYRILNKEGELPEFSAATTAKITLELGTTDVEGKTIDASNPFAIDVQTAKDASKKKPASKIGHTTFAAQTVTDAKEVAVSKVEANAKAEKDGSWTATVTLKNNSSTEAYALTYTPFGATKAKTVKIAAGKEAKATKVVTAAAVELQRVGNAKTKSWAGAAVKFADIKALQDGAGSVVGPDTPEAKEYSISLTPADGETVADGVDTVTVDGVAAADLTSIKAKAGAKVVIVTQKKYTITFTGVTPDESTVSGVTTYTFTMPSANVSGVIE